MSFSDQLNEKNIETYFRCKDCEKNCKLPVERVEDHPEFDHPYEYFATCPHCGKEIKEAFFIKNLRKAQENITGTKSPAISAKNLPTDPNGMQRFNALKTGLFAKKATYFPAGKDRYPECSECEHSNDCAQSGICLEISKIKMMVSHAFNSKNPEILQPLFKDTQADIFVLLKRMLQKVFKDGVAIEKPVFVNGKDGYSLVEYEGQPVMQTDAHPLLKQIATFLQANGLTLNDLSMTPKSVGDQAIQMGNIENTENNRKTIESITKERLELTKAFFKGMSGAESLRKKDTVFEEHDKCLT